MIVYRNVYRVIILVVGVGFFLSFAFGAGLVYYENQTLPPEGFSIPKPFWAYLYYLPFHFFALGILFLVTAVGFARSFDKGVLYRGALTWSVLGILYQAILLSSIILSRPFGPDVFPEVRLIDPFGVFMALLGFVLILLGLLSVGGRIKRLREGWGYALVAIGFPCMSLESLTEPFSRFSVLGDYTMVNFKTIGLGVTLALVLGIFGGRPRIRNLLTSTTLGVWLYLTLRDAHHTLRELSYIPSIPELSKIRMFVHASAISLYASTVVGLLGVLLFMLLEISEWGSLKHKTLQ